MRFFFAMNISDLYKLFIAHPVICTDTRKLSPGAIYFALRGEHFNGNCFASDALKKGCSYVIIDDPAYSVKNDSRMIMVEDALKTLQNLAYYHRQTLNIRIIAVTGTNGKTTTKELLAAVLSVKYKTCFTQGNLNNHIGVPLTLLAMNCEHEIGIIEMGANHIGEIETLCRIAAPDAGLITNIGKAHIEGFGSFNGVIQAKTELYRYLKDNNGTVFYYSGDPLLAQIIGQTGIKGISYGKNITDFCKGESAGADPLLKLSLINETGQPVFVNTRLFGEYNFSNVMAAVCTGKYFGITSEQARKAIEQYYPSNNRSQIQKTDRNTLILDLYNANPSSMEVALKSFLAWEIPGRMVILGEMLELGDVSRLEHQKIVDFVQQHSIPAWLVGKNFGGLVADSLTVLHFADTAQLAAWIKDHPVKDMNILIKGSRGNKLEQVADLL